MTKPNYKILASILSANFARLGEEVAAVIAAGADEIHFDVMDNHYVPNLTVGPVVCAALRTYGINAPIDVHLMTKPVDELIISFAKAGASAITFHPEASEHIDRSIELIRSHGCKAGLAFNPATPLNYLDYVYDKLDLVLLMSVNPGFGGQRFISSAITKIRATRMKIDALCAKQTVSEKYINIVVDGGIKIDNINVVAQAGADSFVVGSAIFHDAKPYTETIRDLHQKLV